MLIARIAMQMSRYVMMMAMAIKKMLNTSKNAVNAEKILFLKHRFLSRTKHKRQIA